MWSWEKKRLMDYADSQARINADFQVTCIDSLERAAHNLLIVLLSGAGGALALFVSIRSDDAALWLQGGTLLASAYLFLIASILVFKCMQAADTYPPANDPKNLYNEKTVTMDYMTLRKEILESKQRCIARNRALAGVKGEWINRVSVSATATPLVFMLGAVAGYWIN